MILDDLTLAVGSLDVIDIRDILRESDIQIETLEQITDVNDTVTLTFDDNKFKNALLKRLRKE
jgi:hypothetical protein